MNSHSWKPVLAWLVLVKTVYLAGVLVFVILWPDFDEGTSAAVNLRWFDPAAPPPSGAGPARHFATWDAQHYLFLSASGYEKGVKSCAFYPLWPLAIRWFSVFTGGNHLIAGMALANAFSLAAWVIFYAVAARRFGETAALWALAFLVAFPGSLFYQFIYSEPLFFLLLMLLWFGLERERYGVAWVAAFLLPLSRAVGVFSVLPIGWNWLMKQPWAWLDRWRWLEGERRRPASDRVGNAVAGPWRDMGLLAAPLLGWAVYLGLIWFWTGNPFEGMEAQKFWGVHSISNLWDVPKFVAGLFAPTTGHAFRGSVLDRSMFLILLYALPLIWRMGKDMMVWTCVLGILPAMSGTFTSFTRFASCTFPVFIALALFSERQGRRWLRWVILATFGVLHVILLWRFVNFRWAG